MRARLISREHGEFEFREQATIGRSADNTVRVEASVVSTAHARISFDPERSRFVLEDLDSLNGTHLDGARIERAEPLGPLHLICFGGSEDFIFQTLTEEAGVDTLEIPPVDKTSVDREVPAIPAALREETPTEALDAPAAAGEGTRIEKDVAQLPEVLAEASASSDAAGENAAEAPAAGREIALIVEHAAGEQTFVLPEGESIFGRSKRADIQLDVADLSRRHAAIKLTQGKITVRDLGSRNHTYLEGNLIEAETPVALGSQLVFGRLRARVVAVGED